LALQVLRALEEQLMKGATHNLIARTRPDVALYVLNQKRAHLRSLEERFAITITVSADESVMAPQAFIIDRGEQVHTIEAAKALAELNQTVAAPLEEEDDLEDVAVAEEEEAEAVSEPGPTAEPGETGPRRRRRRRRRGGRDNGDAAHEAGHEAGHDAAHGEPHERIAAAGSGDEFAGESEHEAADEHVAHIIPAAREGAADDELAEQESGEFAPRERSDAGEPRHDGERRRRRGRRGGRRNRQRNGDAPPLGGADHGPQEHRGHEEYAAPEIALQHEPETFAEPTELAATPVAEPELKAAVADLDASPPRAPAAEPEPVRRRSTVREPAPVAAATEAAPVSAPPAPSVAEPVVIETGDDSAASDRPRKTGWWSRRFAGE
jgi:ribonuclease E